MNDQDNTVSQGEDVRRETPPQSSGGPSAGGGGPQYGPGWGPQAYAQRKSPFVASLLSLMPGLGQIYVGYYQRGFVHLAVVAALITALSSGDMRGIEPFLGLSLAFFWLYNVVDAGRRANHYNLIAEGGSAEELPEFRDDLGGRTAGIILVALGAVLFLHTKMDFDLEWLEEWWPLGLVAFGLHLIRKNRSPER
jgi:hypothetical protein